MIIPTVARRGRAVGAVLVLLGCARFNPQAFRSSDELYRASLERFRRGRFATAQLGFQKLSFDLSARDTLAPRVRFLLAETYFGAQDYVTAAREFRRVADEFPAHPLAPQALLRAGDAHVELWRRPELDPASGQTALAVFQELEGRFPESEAAAAGRVRVRALNERFAQKEFETASFYFRRGAYDSAILYLRSLISGYPSSSRVPPAFVMLVRSYRAIGYREEEQETCAHLLQYYGTRADVREACGDRGTRR